MSNPKMACDEFGAAWHAEHPLPEKHTATQWADSRIKCGEAYREYDPAGYDLVLAQSGFELRAGEVVVKS